MNLFKKLLVGASALVTLAGSGCGTVDKVLDCNHICTKYRDCYDTNYDVSACTQRCNSNSDDSSFRSKANVCEACIDNQSCAGATFSCGADCASVVP